MSISANTDQYTRRKFISTITAASALTIGCGLNVEPSSASGGGSARLTARHGSPTKTIAPGSWLLTENDPSDGVLVVPASYDASHPTPLVVAFAGAGGSPVNSVARLGPQAAQFGFLLLAIGSRGTTWDVITNEFGIDIKFIDTAMKWTIDRCNIDAARTSVSGFSDGASYSLAMGIVNGDLFPRVAAFSPGFIPSSNSLVFGKPEFFVSHGLQDPVLPINQTSRNIVPSLRAYGYTVTYEEFAGVHEVPPAITTEAVAWMLR